MNGYFLKYLKFARASNYNEMRTYMYLNRREAKNHSV